MHMVSWHSVSRNAQTIAYISFTDETGVLTCIENKALVSQRSLVSEMRVGPWR